MDTQFFVFRTPFFEGFFWKKTNFFACKKKLVFPNKSLKKMVIEKQKKVSIKNKFEKNEKKCF
jgi:hypothetical protein